jgi:hypothetical protein
MREEAFGLLSRALADERPAVKAAACNGLAMMFTLPPAAAATAASTATAANTTSNTTVNTTSVESRRAEYRSAAQAALTGTHILLYIRTHICLSLARSVYFIRCTSNASLNIKGFLSLTSLPKLSTDEYLII